MASPDDENPQSPPTKRPRHDAHIDAAAQASTTAAHDASPASATPAHDAAASAADDDAPATTTASQDDAPGAGTAAHDAALAAAAYEPQVARVELNPADGGLDFDIGGGGLQGEALHEDGFAYCWSGARATVGVRGGGKYCFGCRVVAEQAVEMDDTDADQRHLCRVGVSRGDDPVGGLGESGHSFGFGGTGKFSNHNKFVDYGVRFGVGDTIVCAVDLDSKPMASIGFSKNGEWLGIAKYFDASEKGLGLVGAPVSPMQWESAIFPHVLLKNVVVEMQFSREDGLEPVDGYEPWSSACGNGNAAFGPVFAEQSGCEVLMMVGLPASGKSTWADKWVKEHPEKRFILLGTNLALEQMKVPGLLRKHNYGERFERLMDRATVIFNKLLSRAAKIPRNYIIDQTNVYKKARIRKMKPFANYRKTAVVMFPLPSELKSRAANRFREMGKEVPADAVNDMTANFVLPLSKDMPDSKEPFDEVIFVELSRSEAEKNLDEMKHLLPRASTPSYGSFNNQKVSSTCTGTFPPGASGAMPSLSGFQPQMDNPYGRGVLTFGAMAHQLAPWGVQGFQSSTGINQQHDVHLSYNSTTPNQHQIHPSHPNTTYQHQVHSSYPCNPNQQHEIHLSYNTTPDQHQIQPSYPNTPFPDHRQNSSGSHVGPSPYNPNTYNIIPGMQQGTLAPVGDRNLYQAPGSAEAYGRPVHAHPSTPAMYSSHPVDQQLQYHASWNSGNYVPYGQHSYDAHSGGLQYALPVPRPPHMPPVPRPPHLSPPNHMNPPPSTWYN